MKAQKTDEKTDRKKKNIPGVDVERGESIVLLARPSIGAVWPKYIVTLGLYGFWRKRDVSVLTDRRVLIGKGIVRRTERSIPLRNINDAMYQRKGLFAYCEIASTMRGRTDVRRVGPLSTRQARQFTQAILARS
jgi:hypothetical protein